MTAGNLMIKTFESPMFTLIRTSIAVMAICLALVACGAVDITPIPEYSFTAKVSGAEKSIHPGENRDIGVEVTNTGNVKTNFKVGGRLQAPDETEAILPLLDIVLEPQEVGNATWEYRFIDPGKWTLNIDISSPDTASLQGETAVSGDLIVVPCTGRDVYRVWKSGNPTIDCKLWGMRMLWWGRIGKLVSLLSAFAIIAEFVGPVRMRTWGQSLHQVVNVRPLVRRLIAAYLWLFWSIISWLATIPLFWLSSTEPFRTRIKDRTQEHLRDVGTLGRWWKYSIVGTSVLTLVLVVLIPLGMFLSFPLGTLLAILLFLVLMVYFGMFLIFGIPMILVAVLTALNAFILEPFAWLMERGEKGVKIASFGLFLVAAHFDVLAS
ncbi:MAG: hypothetical protein BZY88_09560 [SAR202 cluster bacterium Io17-Chloro-G9]|nr:MAG: hypothetical protein BZY88_09560 [SAR202 cluster bacterium Io17-Chloro-G9]